MKLLSKEEIVSNLQSLNEWHYSENSIVKEFIRKNFLDALSFLNRIGEKAEEMDHHPDVYLHSYNKLKIMISTHSAGGVTEKDFELVKRIEALLNE